MCVCVFTLGDWKPPSRLSIPLKVLLVPRMNTDSKSAGTKFNLQNKQGAEEMALWLRVHAAPAEGSLVPSTHAGQFARIIDLI